ncbi:hypothetical protein HYFRA_00008771 [Hymenoscyphus fraxineus]|uniref:Uncharacterized protein n=1 Tax=Hymenoscyphus fraxineus TaxID=746836 RepID=A0A9N9L0G2_9HELO|nr:hypothetical protein HYFRA_00008771 [Hymenoscyphus fraxineus]
MLIAKLGSLIHIFFNITIFGVPKTHLKPRVATGLSPPSTASLSVVVNAMADLSNEACIPFERIPRVFHNPTNIPRHSIETIAITPPQIPLGRRPSAVGLPNEISMQRSKEGVDANVAGHGNN